MSPLRHPPPPPLHGLLCVKPTSLSRRHPRFAHLCNGTLDLRRRLTGPVETSLTLPGATLRSDPSTRLFHVTTAHQRLRLYAPSDDKFLLWDKALRAAARSRLETHYALAGPCGVGERVWHGWATGDGDGEGEEVCVRRVVGEAAVRRECRIASVVRHECVVEVRDVFERKGGADIVMERFDRDLHDVMRKRGRMQGREAAQVIRAVLKGVAYLHGRNIVHRDVKPENVVWGKAGAKLCGFAMADFVGKRGETETGGEQVIGGDSERDEYTQRSEERTGVGFGKVVQLSSVQERRKRERGGIGYHSRDGETQQAQQAGGFAAAIDGCTLTAMVGAPSYVAPEVVRGRRYGKPVDVWGCGVVLFYMLTGRLPFEGATAGEVLRRVGRARVEWAEGEVTGQERAFVELLLRDEPMRRVTAEAALEHPWLVGMAQDEAAAAAAEGDGEGLRWQATEESASASASASASGRSSTSCGGEA